ncbi:Nucleotide-binding universal stress protein, UspA family [Chitinophaga sp. CF118]|uniref:universal stress protein n=1 Tax=Chitinophaga sp. CF118 TaxID=1884367 RepID=UPI0008F3FB06|nr:universal stress protein [Chitinophaga sp. CF118]SFD26519.1 Nucleotide-binding universal stress protein, UspA family [Chitinophaga sp. CF118]
MKTLLIPVDFTDTSDNAVTFAAEWCRRYKYERVILLRTFYDNVFDHIVISAEYAPVSQEYRQQEREETIERLEELSERLSSSLGEGVEVSSVVSEIPLLRAILGVIKEEKPEMLLLGSDNYSYSSGSFIAGNVISIVKASPIRVLIVPAGYTYKPVETALVPCDYNTMDVMDKFNKLETSPLISDTKLLVLNVDAKERFLHPDEAFNKKESALHEYLKNFNHELHYSNDKNIINGILNFTQANDVQLIVALRGKRSFLYYLTHKSISEGIYRNAKEPVLILK